MDAIAGHLSVGEPPEAIADEMDAPPAAVLGVQEWMKRWPGAWR